MSIRGEREGAWASASRYTSERRPPSSSTAKARQVRGSTRATVSRYSSERRWPGLSTIRKRQARDGRVNALASVRLEGEDTRARVSRHVNECLFPCAAASEPIARRQRIYALPKSLYRLREDAWIRPPYHSDMFREFLNIS
jgi:hypothetical protein